MRRARSARSSQSLELYTHTFKVVRRPADGHAYAMVLAEAHGLSYAAVTERLRG